MNTWRMRFVLTVFACTAALAGTPAATQLPLLRPSSSVPLRLAVDADDSDEDGVFDAGQDRDIPTRDLLAIEVGIPGRTTTLRLTGPIRAIADGRPLANPLSIRGAKHLFIQGLRASAHPSDARISAMSDERSETLTLTVLAMSFVDVHGKLMRATHQALAPTRGMESQHADSAGSSGAPFSDEHAFRLELFDASAREHQVEARLEVVDPSTDHTKQSVPVLLHSQASNAGLFRSAWLRLVGDVVDEQAWAKSSTVVRVALRDRVRVRFGNAHQELRVGRPGDEDGPNAARRATLRVHVLRQHAGDRPTVGTTTAQAEALAREQVAVANEIWLQCFIDFGRPADAEVRVVDPPPPTLLAIADEDGLPAAGGSKVRFRANGYLVGPLSTAAGATPIDTALRIADALRALGFRALPVENPPTDDGAGRSADVFVQTARGALVTLSPDGHNPLSTDSRQTLRIGSVDLSDGLQDFNNINAATGTLEERTLIHAVTDHNPATIDLIVVNAFSSRTRQGEAFIASQGGPLGNVLVIDRTAVLQQRTAWTQAHELGHILLDHPLHPDDIHVDRPWLLMDADSSDSSVSGPKRLSASECRRVRDRSFSAEPAQSLLRRLDTRTPPTAAVHRSYDLGYRR